MKGPTRAWKRSGALIASAAAGLVGVGLCAAPASAHTPNWSVTCNEVTVDLTAYNGGVKNTVTITADGKDLLPAQTFGSSFHDKLTIPEHDKELTLQLSVVAGDGKQYSKDDMKTSPVCQQTAPPAKPGKPAESAKPAEQPSQKPSEQPSAVPSQSAESASAAPVADASSAPPKDLAETGSSSSTPIIAGAAAVVVIAGGGILLATRKRSAAARH